MDGDNINRDEMSKKAEEYYGNDPDKLDEAAKVMAKCLLEGKHVWFLMIGKIRWIWENTMNMGTTNMGRYDEFGKMQRIWGNTINMGNYNEYGNIRWIWEILWKWENMTNMGKYNMIVLIFRTIKIKFGIFILWSPFVSVVKKILTLNVSWFPNIFANCQRLFIFKYWLKNYNEVVFFQCYGRLRLITNVV